MGLIFQSGCREAYQRFFYGDPTPKMDLSDAELSPVTSEKLCSYCTVIKFNIATGEVPVPSTMALDYLNELNSQVGIDPLYSTNSQIPIRIPFDGKIDFKYNSRWQNSILIINTANIHDRVYPWPTSINISGQQGDFAAVVLTEFNELILVPTSQTFIKGNSYVVIITNSMLDTNESPLGETVVSSLLKSSESLIDNNDACPDIDIDEACSKFFELTGLNLAHVSALEAERARLDPILEDLDEIDIKRSDIIGAFVFTTSGNSTTAFTNSKLKETALSVFNPALDWNNNNDNNDDDDYDEDEVWQPTENDNANYWGAADSPISFTMLKPNDTANPTGNKLFTPNLLDRTHYGLNDLDEQLSNIYNTPNTPNSLNNNTNNSINMLAYFTEEIDLNQDGQTDSMPVLKELNEAGNLNIKAIYRGHYSCTNFLTKDPATKEWILDIDITGENPGGTCLKINPNENPADLSSAEGMDFWLSMPEKLDNLNPKVVIYQHGFFGDATEFIALANTFANKNIAVIAIDAFGHGVRSFKDINGDGKITRDDSGGNFINSMNPSITAGYMIQTLMDIYHLAIMLKVNPIMLHLLGLEDSLNNIIPELDSESNNNLSIIASAKPSINFVGRGLGAILGILISEKGDIPIDRFVLNGIGADFASILVNTELFTEQMKSELEVLGELETFKSLIGMQLAHSFFSAVVDPLSFVDNTGQADILVQQMYEDEVIPAQSMDIWSLSMNLYEGDLPGCNDDNGCITGTVNRDGDSLHRSSWLFYPWDYEPLETGARARHNFLIDKRTTATCAGQIQAREFILSGRVLEPDGPEILQACE